MLNLATFEHQYPETRAFFIAGFDVFYTPIQLLYSRRIGLAPPTPTVRDGETAEAPEPTKIYATSKLVGTLGSGVGAASGVYLSAGDRMVVNKDLSAQFDVHTSFGKFHNAMLHAGVLKKFGLYGLIRIALPLLPIGARYWTNLLLVLLLGNIIYIGLVTIAQKKAAAGHAAAAPAKQALRDRTVQAVGEEASLGRRVGSARVYDVQHLGRASRPAQRVRIRIHHGDSGIACGRAFQSDQLGHNADIVWSGAACAIQRGPHRRNLLGERL